MTLTITQWMIIILCGVLAGVSKTGIPGIGIVIVPLMAMLMPAKESVGLVLPILIIADVFAASYYRRHAQWGLLVKLLPCAVLGVFIGYFLLKRINNEQLKPIIGFIVVAMLIVQAVYEWRKSKQDLDNDVVVPPSKSLAITFGLAAGIATMMANAAGPIMVLYLLTSGLPKREFIGTAAWYFFIVNWIKVPFALNLGIITVETLKINLMIIPAIAVGAVLGVFVLKKMPQTIFRQTARILALLSAVRLLLG